MRSRTIVVAISLFLAGRALAADVTLGTGIVTSDTGSNVVIGNNASDTFATANNNVVVGNNATTDGISTVVIGSNASSTTVTASGVVIGDHATASGGVAVGTWAINKGGIYTTVIGNSAINYSTGNYNTIVGGAVSTDVAGNNFSGGTILGAAAKIQGNAVGATAIGFSSIATNSNSVSVGVAAGTPGFINGLYRTIENVADGVQAHDGATVGQLSTVQTTATSAQTTANSALATATTANANSTTALNMVQGTGGRLDALSDRVDNLSNRMGQAETGIASAMAMSSASSSASLAAIRSARGIGLGMGAGIFAGRSVAALSFAAGGPRATVAASVSLAGKPAAQIGAGWSF